MPKEVIYLYRRFGWTTFASCTPERFAELSGHKLFETKTAVSEDDYAALEKECERLSNQRDAILLQARIWACEAKAQRSITQGVIDALGGIPNWGPVAAKVTEQLAERDAALLQVEAQPAPTVGTSADAARWLFYAPKVAELLKISVDEMTATVDAALLNQAGVVNP